MTADKGVSHHPYSQLKAKLPIKTADEGAPDHVLNSPRASDLTPYPEADYGHTNDGSPVKPVGPLELHPLGYEISVVPLPPHSPSAHSYNGRLSPVPPRSPHSEGPYYSPQLQPPAEDGFDPFVQLYLSGVVDPFPVEPAPPAEAPAPASFNAFPTEPLTPMPHREFSPSNLNSHSDQLQLNMGPAPPLIVGDASQPLTQGGAPLKKTRGNKSHPHKLPPHLQYQQQPFLPQNQPFNYQLREMSPEAQPPYPHNALLPTFAGGHGALPLLNLLLTLLSLTNLNLNQGPADLYLRLETLLLVPGGPKYGHTRLVSLLLSFFYDRSDAAMMVDFSQNIIQQYLGSNALHLVPRMKTIELYRKNAKKSQDPTVIFQFAQYMLQTALMLNDPNNPSSATNGDGGNRLVLLAVPKPGTPGKKLPRKLRSQTDLSETVDERKLQRLLLKEAVHYLKKLSDKGYAEVQYLLADAYSLGALGKVDNRDAFVLFQQAAKHGHTELAYRALICFEEGLGTSRDARKAVEYLKIAALKNHPAAMYKLGVYMFFGRMGVSRNLDNEKIGIKWLTRALNVANELTAGAPYELGKLYFNGYKDIIIADKQYALELYSQAAALGHVQLAAILGQAYEVGDIVPQDGNLLIHYYTQAALGGDPESMLAMCAWFLVGCEPHLPKDEAEAFEWAKRAAMCNFPKAQFAVANFYDKGIGCIRNDKEAQTWYTKAAENGDEKSLARITDKQVREKVAKQMKKRPVRVQLGQLAAEDKDCVIM